MDEGAPLRGGWLAFLCLAGLLVPGGISLAVLLPIWHRAERDFRRTNEQRTLGAQVRGKVAEYCALIFR